ncbi:MAG: hypothetical protein AAFY03_07110, partial [Pseudomonadota bacterium]
AALALTGQGIPGVGARAECAIGLSDHCRGLACRCASEGARLSAAPLEMSQDARPAGAGITHAAASVNFWNDG